MLIDWFTVFAQLVNFLILVWLLKRLLYRPILNALDAREKRIARELADAEAKMAEAIKESDEFQRKNAVFEQQRAQLMSEAADEVKAERQRLLDEARRDADSLSAKRLETLRNEAHTLNQTLGRQVRQEVFAIARKTLRDLAAASLEACIAEAFARRLREIDTQTKARLGEVLKNSREPARISSAFELPAAQRAEIQQVLDETFSATPSTRLRTGIPVRFETNPNLICGIELDVSGQKVAWSIAEYLSSLENGVDELLKAKVQIQSSASAPKPETK
jgi:F-type H+-transporting ATPase subunit b